MIIENFNAYLNSAGEKPVAILAWCYGQWSLVERVVGHTEMANTYLKKAESLDQHFSRAFATPVVDRSPVDPGYQYRSFFRPF